MPGEMIRLRHRLQSRLSRAPFPLWALAVCLVAALAGFAALDDYGVSWDGAVRGAQPRLGHLTLDYLTGGSDELFAFSDRDYGVAFELPLAAAERALGLEDRRSIYLLRHYLTHLFFIAGAFFAALLAWRMTGSRWLGLFALLLFLLHPRLYADSFTNSKDLPFLSMLMIALYCLHRAFRRDTLGAFILCGIAVGLLTNIRIMGLMLFPAVIVMRGLDFGYEFRRPERRRHLLLTAAAFILAAVLTLYATWPWLWGDPLGRFAEAVTEAAGFAGGGYTLFRGELVNPQSPPWDYIPVWMSITTPPAALLLALAGGAAALYGGLARPQDSLHNGPQRFELLLACCLILPVIAVIALDSTLYSGWRHLYFLYAPLCLLAVVGLQRLLAAAGRVKPFPGRMFRGRKVPGGPAAVRGALYGAAAVGLVVIAVQMLQLHPFQRLYFNFLTDRQTPEYLGSQYDLRSWRTWQRQGLEYLLERYPDERLRVYISSADRNDIDILPQAQRQRLAVNPDRAEPHDFYISRHPVFTTSGGETALFPPSIHAFQVYRNTILNIAVLDLARADDAGAARHRERYRSVAAGEPVIDSEVAVYQQGRTVSWVIDPCNPREWGAAFSLAVYPLEAQRVLPDRRNYGYPKLYPPEHPLVRFDGRCFAQAALPEYALTRFRASIGRFDAATGRPAGTWVGHYYPGLPDTLEAIARRRASEPPPPDGARWEVFQESGRILYAKADCAPADREATFFLHLTPVNPDDLPDESREYGYDNLDFQFDWRGLEMGDECLAVVPLPDYPVAAIATGQYTNAGRLWETAQPRQ